MLIKNYLRRTNFKCYENNMHTIYYILYIIFIYNINLKKKLQFKFALMFKPYLFWL